MKNISHTTENTLCIYYKGQSVTDVKEERLQLICDDTCRGNRFRLSAKRTSPFKSAGASVQSITGSRGLRISCSNGGYTMFRGSVKGTGYPLHSPVSPSLPLPCVTACHHVSTGFYQLLILRIRRNTQLQSGSKTFLSGVLKDAVNCVGYRRQQTRTNGGCNDAGTGKTKYSNENLPLCNFFHCG